MRRGDAFCVLESQNVRVAERSSRTTFELGNVRAAERSGHRTFETRLCSPLCATTDASNSSIVHGIAQSSRSVLCE